MKALRIGLYAIVIVVLIIGLVLTFGPAQIEKGKNIVLPHSEYQISAPAFKLHNSLVIGDLHADSTLWARDLLERKNYGQVDIPRMVDGNAAIQIFTSVTKAPAGLNIEQNSADARDNITLLAMVQSWPKSTWSSLLERALYQASRLKEMSNRAPDKLSIIYSAKDLELLLAKRQRGEKIVGGILGIEGLHALEGDLSNVDRLFDSGFRVMGLHHFFDNKLGGSLHGDSGGGLTQFGERVFDRLQDRNIIVDLAHSGPKVVEEALKRSKAPMIISHTGFHGHCQSKRNISDELMKRVAEGGGLIGVGYWKEAICDPTPKGIVAALRYGVDLIGEDHIALGSDFDGTAKIPFDISELAVLTEEMLQAGFTETEIRKVMGGNMVRLLLENMPTK